MNSPGTHTSPLSSLLQRYAHGIPRQVAEEQHPYAPDAAASEALGWLQIAEMPDAAWEAFEERAAILEYDGKLTRGEADSRAAAIVTASLGGGLASMKAPIGARNAK